MLRLVCRGEQPARRLVVGSLVLVSLLVAGCQPADSSGGAAPVKPFSAGGPLRAVCTTGMVADVVRAVGGERVDVFQMMGAGVDPHLYKASPGDMSQLSSADVIFYSGLHLEGKISEVLQRMERKKRTVPVTATIPADRLLKSDAGFPDPHVWFDAALWSHTAEAVRAALAEADPPHAAEFATRAAAYKKKLLALDEECRTALAAIPAEQRVLVTAHDAFQYFGRAYDVEVEAIQGISTESEAGVQQINRLVELIAKRKIQAVFVETSVSDRNIKALVEGCGARGHKVAIGGQLYSDALGDPGTPEGTYAGMFRKNVATLLKGLQP